MSDRPETNMNKNCCDRLNRLSMEELENLLKMADFSSDADAVDTDYILRILEVMEKREKENSSESTLPDTAKAWNSFQKSYLPLVGTGESLYPAEGEAYVVNKTEELTDNVRRATDAPHGHRRKFSLRPVYAVAMIVIVLLTGTLTAQALGYDVWKAVAQWTRDVFQFVPGTAPSQEEERASELPDSTSNIFKESLSAYGIEDVAIVPSWIPERFEAPKIEAIYTPYNTIVSAVYTNDEDVLVISLANTADGESIHYEKDQDEVVLYTQNGITHYIMSNNAQYSAVWLVGIYECTIYGTVSEAELKKIIDSIYER